MEKETLADITAVILTFNEEKHIKRCIESIISVVKRIVVIDSFSTDETLNILKKFNVEIFQNKWVNYASQMNWGVENTKINTNWILRLDADEFFSEGLSNEIKGKLSGLSSNICGVSINRRCFFLGSEIKFGGMFPQKIVRIWRNGRGKIDEIWHDEHVIVKGEIAHVNNDIIDNNLHSLTWWIQKHKRYSNLESVNFFLTQKDKMNNSFARSRSEKLKFLLKYKIYYGIPLGLRPLLYFFYRYFFRLGFLDGWQGLVYHFLQGFWYRFLIDLKIFKIKRVMKLNKLNLKQAVKNTYGYDI